MLYNIEELYVVKIRKNIGDEYSSGYPHSIYSLNEHEVFFATKNRYGDFYLVRNNLFLFRFERSRDIGEHEVYASAPFSSILKDPKKKYFTKRQLIKYENEFNNRSKNNAETNKNSGRDF